MACLRQLEELLLELQRYWMMLYHPRGVDWHKLLIVQSRDLHRRWIAVVDDPDGIFPSPDWEEPEEIEFLNDQKVLNIVRTKMLPWSSDASKDRVKTWQHEALTAGSSYPDFAILLG